MSLNPVFQKIRNDAANGKNVNMVICGAPRTGKSWSALRLAERLDDAFSTDRVVWTIEQFMSLITSKTLKDGSVVIFDEAGVCACHSFKSFEFMVCQMCSCDARIGELELDPCKCLQPHPSSLKHGGVRRYCKLKSGHLGRHAWFKRDYRVRTVF